MQCPNCHKEIPDNSRFCLECGAPLKGGAAEGVMNTGSGAIAASGGAAAGAGGAAVGGDVAGNVVIAQGGVTIYQGEQPVKLTAVERESALGRYLHHVISRTRYLQLQGIRSGGKLVNIELESIYITLRATRQRTLENEDAWLAEEGRLAPGELQRLKESPRTETVVVKIEEALAAYPRLVILGDPGSGKTTLQRYLALRYARDRAEGTTVLQDQLGLPESGHLPILLPLRNLGAYLKKHHPTDDGTEGHARLLAFLREYLKGERIDAPDDFFDADLAAGRVVVLLDGMDEVGDDELRRRVARLIDSFAAAYPVCRVVVTSRVVGYSGAARLGEGFATTTVRDFSLADVEHFLTHWHRLVAIGQMGPGESAEVAARSQTGQLMAAIRANPRVRELAINPLMLTVIALVHRDRVKLPDRRAELYAEAVDVLLGKWDEARGVPEPPILDDRPFDIVNRRLMLREIALGMQNAQKREIETGALQTQLQSAFVSLTPNKAAAVRAASRFLTVIQERTGLLVEAGPGAYRFSHLTFQEYLAVNPLLLTVVALVHRYRAALPEKRSELYEEAVEVLLAGWDKAKGLDTETQLAGRVLDSGDRRSLLEPVAFWLHERNQRELELDDLRPLLLPTFLGLASGDKRLAEKAVAEFLRVVNERSGLLMERGTGVYGFAHLTFQEYLAARALASRDDFITYTLAHLADPWWREVVLLEAGYLGTQGKRRVSELIRAIMTADPKTEPEPHHHLMLAAECLVDVGGARVEGDLLGEVKQRLQAEADAAVPEKLKAKKQLLRKIAAMNALARLESGQLGATAKLWKLPCGEPEWTTIPAGEFWMGGEEEFDGKPIQRVFVPEFQIARALVTNAQYALFMKDVRMKAPEHWRGGTPPAGKDDHPVVNVNWHDAQAYCKWLSAKIGREVRLPTEAEWEKAARGDRDRRAYPWGDDWRELHCNSQELGLGETSPVGLFLNGAGPSGCLDMIGNVWEWCQSKHKSYPYKSDDGREELSGNDTRVLRGGAFDYGRRDVRCAYRYGDLPDNRYGDLGCRVCVVPPALALDPLIPGAQRPDP